FPWDRWPRRGIQPPSTQSPCGLPMANMLSRPVIFYSLRSCFPKSNPNLQPEAERLSDRRYPIYLPRMGNWGFQLLDKNVPSNGETQVLDKSEVAVIGAGPYGLSIAAHLRAKGLT